MEPKIISGDWLTFDDVLIIPGTSDIEPREASLRATLVPNIELEVPILSAAMDRVTEARMALALSAVGGLGVLHRNQSIDAEAEMVKEVKQGGGKVAAATGPFDEERVKALVAAGVDVLAIDCAHGHNEKVLASAEKFKKILGTVPLIVGNIATAEAARDYRGIADAVKIGVGPGSICTTRMISGVGVPQLTAIIEVATEAHAHGMRAIADGGMRTSGDVAKAFAAGADAVMLGNMLAGTDESPGESVERGGKMFKEYRGMGSRAVLEAGGSKDRYLTEGRKLVAEGVSGLVKTKGPVANVVGEIVSGVKVAFGYVGARTLAEFQQKARLIKITNAGTIEGMPHTLESFEH